MSCAVKFGVGVNIADDKTAGGVQGDDGAQFCEDGVACTVGDWCHRAETDVTQDGVEKTKTLNKKKSTQRVTF